MQTANIQTYFPNSIETEQFDSQVTSQVCSMVLAYGNHISNSQSVDSRGDLHSLPLYRSLQEKIMQGERLTFVLPAFPAKSSNSLKTSGSSVDMGEVLAMQGLNGLCENIKKVYSPGANILICSDGRVFNDIVFVSNEDLALYKKGLHSIREKFSLNYLHFFDLDDCFDHQDYKKMRNFLVENFSMSIEDIKEEVKSNEQTNNMFCGIHRFMKDDLAFHKPELTKSQVHKMSKSLAYQVIQRSRAWDKLLEKHFSSTTRLSIHPYPIHHHKFGIKLVASSDKWATPWHNVVVKIKDQFQLMKKEKALSLGASLKLFLGEYKYYELA